MMGRLLLCAGVLVALAGGGTDAAWAQQGQYPEVYIVGVISMTPLYGENPNANGGALIVFVPDDPTFPYFGDAYFALGIIKFQPETLYTIQFQDPSGTGGFVQTNWRGRGVWYFNAPDVMNPALFPEDSRVEVFRDLNENRRWDAGEPGAFGLYELWTF